MTDFEKTILDQYRKPKNRSYCQCPNCQVVDAGGEKVIEESSGKQLHNCHFEYCSKVYNDCGKLTRHLKTHVSFEQRPFVCEWEGCNKKFVQRSHLKEHLLRHTGERRFICQFKECGKKFLESSGLNRHMNIHNRKKNRGFDSGRSRKKNRGLDSCDNSCDQDSSSESHEDTPSIVMTIGESIRELSGYSENQLNGSTIEPSELQDQYKQHQRHSERRRQSQAQPSEELFKHNLQQIDQWWPKDLDKLDFEDIESEVEILDVKIEPKQW